MHLLKHFILSNKFLKSKKNTSLILKRPHANLHSKQYCQVIHRLTTFEYLSQIPFISLRAKSEKFDCYSTFYFVSASIRAEK